MDYKIIFAPCLGCSAAFEKEYGSLEEAETAMTAISLYTLMLHECSLMPDRANCGMVLKREDGLWLEVDDDSARLHLP